MELEDVLSDVMGKVKEIAACSLPSLPALDDLPDPEVLRIKASEFEHAAQLLREAAWLIQRIKAIGSQEADWREKLSARERTAIKSIEKRKKVRISGLADLAKLTALEVIEMPHVGSHTLERLRERLAKVGLSFAGDEPDGPEA